MMHDMKSKIVRLRGLLKDPRHNRSKEQVLKIELLIWVFEGVVGHSLSLTRLYQVSKTYERIKVVPQGYMMADLYTRQEPPRHMQ